MNHRILIASVLVAGVAAPAAAQVPVHDKLVAAEFEGPVPSQARFEMAFESKVTTGRPYSADATTEFVQALVDGNRIAQKTTVRVYRDSDGRTRREELGPAGTPVSISIYDPVTNASYVLNPETRTAYKSAVRVVFSSVPDKIMERAAVESVSGTVTLVAPDPVTTHVPKALHRKMHVEAGAQAAAGVAAGHMAVRVDIVKNGKGESLGQKSIDSVLAEGTRRTVVIPAGSIGNQQDITIVAEEWFSPDLDVVVMTKHSDPRTGESTYSLSNIVRGEPSPALFEVPSDYTIKDSSYMRPPAFE